MKIVKVIASFFILMLIGIFISYGDTDNSGYDKFLETFNNSITININAQVELDVDLTIFKKYEKAKSEPSQGWEGLNENYWLMTNKSIIITAKK